MGMMRPPCCDKAIVKKGLWSSEEDAKLHAYVSTHGTGNWTNVPKKAGLKRCGKSCRLRWTNYLRPNLKHEGFNSQEEELIVTLHALIGSRWAVIANQLPGRTDNDVKNYWNTKLSKKLALRGIDPVTHRPISDIKNSITTLHITASSSSSSPAASFTAAGRHNSCFSSLNRDLKNILLSHSMPPPQPEPSTLSSASSNDTTPLVQRYPFENKSSAARALPPPPQPPSCEQLEWAEFLAEDAFMYLEEQGACRGKAFVAACAGSGLNDEEEVSSVTGGAAAGVPRSFVEEMLDRDKEMMSELSGILTGHYFL